VLIIGWAVYWAWQIINAPAPPAQTSPSGE
jgi:hypothetical protein